MNSKSNYKIKENSWIAKLAARKLKTKNVAIVLHDTIHLFGADKSELLNDKHWLRHELRHIQQWKKYGFLGFIILYLFYSIKYGYENNPLEKDARQYASNKEIENKFLLDTAKANTTQINPSGFFYTVATIIGLILLYLVVLKAMSIPITHDEAGQIQFYARQNLYEILTYETPWPTNHILNTVLIKLFCNIGGYNQYWGRLPNIIAFILYYIYAVKWSNLYFKFNILGLLASISLIVLNLYLFDFFSLARGYGLALAMQLMAMYHIYRASLYNRESDIIIGQFTLFLMVMANFSWLVCWAAIELLVLIGNVISKNWLHMKWQLVGVILVIVYSAIPVYRMTSTDQFVYWEGQGIITNTLIPLWERFNYHDVPNIKYLGYFKFLFISALLVIFLYSIASASRLRLWLFPLLLFTCLGISISQNYFLGTPFLTGRTALLYYPVFGLIFISELRAVFSMKYLFSILSVIFIIGIGYNFYKKYTPNSAKEWNYDYLTFHVLDDMTSIHEQTGEDVYLDCHWIFNPSINFYVSEGSKYQWLHLTDYHKESQIRNHVPFYYTNSDDYEEAEREGYEIVWRKGWHTLYHLKSDSTDIKEITEPSDG